MDVPLPLGLTGEVGAVGTGARDLRGEVWKDRGPVILLNRRAGGFSVLVEAIDDAVLRADTIREDMVSCSAVGRG